MQFCKQIPSGSRGLLAKSRKIAEALIRGYSKKDSSSSMCSKKTLDCVDDHPKPRSAKNIEKTFPFYHLIKYKEECCDNKCVDKDFPSFDECLLEVSDKNKRKYQVTWVECPPVKIKPKKICCFKKSGQRPPIVRRSKKAKPSTACQPECTNLEGPCPKIASPGCRPVAKNVKCHIHLAPSGCRKVKAPYPAFSECSRPKLKKGRKVECNCLASVAVCDMYRILKTRGAFNLNPCKKSKGKAKK